MPKQQLTEPGSSRNSGSIDDDADPIADIRDAYELLETVEWCRERRKNPKGNTAPPPNDRIFEARVTDAVMRRQRLLDDYRASQRKHVPGRPSAFDMLEAVRLSAPAVLQQLSASITDDRRALFSDPRTDERLCDEFLDAAVAQVVGNTQGLPVLDLRARASALGWALVPPAQYADFYRREILPALNRLGGEVSRCPECCGAFVLGDKRQRYCSAACAARQRNRGRQKVGNGLSAPETARKRADDWLRRHWGSCKLCRDGEPCERREAMLQGDDALSRRSFDVTPEVAEEMHESQGRKRKQGSS